MTGLTGNATAKTEGELQYYENDQLIGERYRLDVRSLPSNHRSVGALAQGEGMASSIRWACRCGLCSRSAMVAACP